MANSLHIRVAARRPLAISFLLTSCLGRLALAVRWSGHGDRAMHRIVLFVVIMIALHVAGYVAYVMQSAVRDGRNPEPFRLAISPRYRGPIISAAFQQLLAGVLASLLLCDCGRIVLPAALGHWIGSLLIILRRPTAPTDDDLQFVRYGFWFALGAAAVAALLLGRLY